VFFPQWIKDQLQDEGFVEAMAYPKINTPMYESLKKISDELFLPNIELIEHNSITLLETNQKFIESYMVGLNHEFARELLWREYPTDQRGSYFRQCWDTSVALKDPVFKDNPEDVNREPFYDIPKLHEWRRLSKLGGHDNRQKPGEPPKEEVILVIRGELLKKYPTAVIYAHKAAWTKNDVKLARSLQNQSEGDKEKPDPKFVRTPLYSAKVDPDIYFFGFDLTVEEALGGTGETNADRDKPGWFFCIKERPGEPRFGLDIDQDGEKPENWNDLAWNDVLPANAPPGSFIPVGNATIEQDLNANPLETDDAEKIEQRADDMAVSWKKNMNAADVAYILYQVPVLMAVHAVEMLPTQKP
jgi:hypothetical protein